MNLINRKLRMEIDAYHLTKFNIETNLWYKISKNTNCQLRRSDFIFIEETLNGILDT